ncbi:hypothetical protein ACJX0J_035423, partial [Zea mays]
MTDRAWLATSKDDISAIYFCTNSKKYRTPFKNHKEYVVIHFSDAIYVTNILLGFHLLANQGPALVSLHSLILIGKCSNCALMKVFDVDDCDILVIMFLFMYGALNRLMHALAKEDIKLMFSIRLNWKNLIVALGDV